MFSSRTSWTIEANALSRMLTELRQSGRDILDLTVSNPTQCGFSYDPEILSALAQPGGLSYEPQPRGLRSTREAIAAYYAELAQPATVDPENILLTASTSEAYSFIFRLLCEPGDNVLVPRPSYPLFEFLAGLNDVSLQPYPLIYDHGWHLDLHSLKSVVTPRTRAVIVVHPNNPTGSFAGAQEMQALSAFCGDN